MQAATWCFSTSRLDSKAADWLRYLAAYPAAGPAAVQLHDSGAFEGAAARAFGVQSIPSYWLIGRDGRILTSRPPLPSAGPAIEAAAGAGAQTLVKPCWFKSSYPVSRSFCKKRASYAVCFYPATPGPRRARRRPRTTYPRCVFLLFYPSG
ncbi:MAG: hypothetical protein WKG07_13435 [Hymenobacter sp.]